MVTTPRTSSVGTVVETPAQAPAVPDAARAAAQEVAESDGVPYALLRAGYPYHATLGMRRVTTYPMDLALGDEGRLYVLCRNDGQGGEIRKTNWDDEDLGTIGGSGRGDGQFLWPVQLLRDRHGNLYVSDEGLHRITVLAPDGTFLAKWGEEGSDPGQLNRPSGIAFDAEDNLWVADTLNHRVQRFTKEGQYLGGFGTRGSGDGQLDMPWGVAVDGQGDVYVADWRNDRVQKFSPDGELLLKICDCGSTSPDAKLSRPAGVTVDAHGDIYVADRGHHRVVLFDKTGRYVEQFTGDATLSKSGRRYILANPKVLRAREMTTLEPQKKLRGPASVRLGTHEDGSILLYIPDFGSHRIQVYKKEAYPLGADDIWPEPKAPFLYNV